MFNPDSFKKGLRFAVMALMLAVCTQAVGTHSTLLYAADTSSDSAGADVGPKDGCEKGGAAYHALEKAVQYNTANETTSYDTAYMSGTKTARDNMAKVGNVFDSVSNRICFDMMSRFDSLLESLLGIAGTILNMLIGFINQLISLACQYVVAAITNVLNSVCIPLPDLPSMPGFGGPDRKSCNGVSLADMMSISTRPFQVPYYSRQDLDNQLTGYARTFGTMITRSTGSSSGDDSTRQ